MTAFTFKQQACDLVDQLPDTATWEDLIEAIRRRQASEVGAVVLDADLIKAFAVWTSQLEAALERPAES